MFRWHLEFAISNFSFFMTVYQLSIVVNPCTKHLSKIAPKQLQTFLNPNLLFTNFIKWSLPFSSLLLSTSFSFEITVDIINLIKFQNNLQGLVVLEFFQQSSSCVVIHSDGLYRSCFQQIFLNTFCCSSFRKWNDFQLMIME